MLKSAINSRTGRWLAARCLSGYLTLIRCTSPLRIVDRQSFDEVFAQDRGVIIAFWHDQLALAPSLVSLAPTDVHMLVSAHRDGAIMAEGARQAKLKFIRGSAANPKKKFKNKHGATAILQMMSVLEEGGIVAMTPDGPRGPRHKVQPGILHIAARTGAPILPGAAVSRRGARLKSWDRFFVPLPGAPHYAVGGKPIFVPKNADPQELEMYTQHLEDSLNEALAMARKAAKMSGPDEELQQTPLMEQDQ